MKKIFLFLFFATVLVHLTGILIDAQLVQDLSKPLIMLSLCGFYLSFPHRSVVVVFAIVLSLIGDVFLIFPGYFVHGLVAFLLSHVFYILAYRQHQGEPDANVLQGVHRMRLAFPIILAGTGLVIVLYPTLGELRIPVIIYAVVLVAMALQALFRYGKTNTASFWMVFAGAVLFMISDSVLAIDKFLNPVMHGHFWIMVTYIGAQFLIVRGLTRHEQ
jgi:uncharacterized membrane protein YhhN